MAQHRRDIKAAKGGQIQKFEHSEIFDDSLLPDAGEIEKLSKVDPEILTWLKSRAEKEQDFRHEAYSKRLKVVDNHNRRDHNTSRFALIVYFFLVAACVTASFFLVREGHNVQGTIFGSAAIILALAVLLTRRKTKDPNSDRKDQGNPSL